MRNLNFAVNTWQFWNVVKLFATPSTTPALVGGGLLGYVMYDVTHYYLHHGQPSKDSIRHLKVRGAVISQWQKFFYQLTRLFFSPSETTQLI